MSKMYASQTSFCKVNDLIYQLLRVKKGDVDSSHLPPCQETFMIHAMRVNYQACIWKMYLEQESDTPIPEVHDWMFEDEQMIIDCLPDPQVVMELIVCKCSRVCKAPECHCFANALKCSLAGKNQSCDNMIDDDFEDSVDDTVDEDKSDYVDDENVLNEKKSILYIPMMLADC